MITEADMTTLCDWHHGMDVSGWLATERYEGLRVIWDGFTLWHRTGEQLDAPPAFLKGLPCDIALDGVLWGGPGGTASVRRFARRGRDAFTPEMKLVVFDAVLPGPYLHRIEQARQALMECPNAFVTTVSRIGSTDEAVELARLVRAEGGTGLVLRSPEDKGYRPGRNPLALRLG
ncbi:MAG: hypothetical protein H7A46_16115 [Verrucomicrobiales bacterium]|nr:hypothetical protein [Verrucomicrobiales bacterium]